MYVLKYKTVKSPWACGCAVYYTHSTSQWSHDSREMETASRSQLVSHTSEKAAFQFGSHLLNNLSLNTWIISLLRGFQTTKRLETERYRKSFGTADLFPSLLRCPVSKHEGPSWPLQAQQQQLWSGGGARYVKSCLINSSTCVAALVHI